jgi:hypothetical protein
MSENMHMQFTAFYKYTYSIYCGGFSDFFVPKISKLSQTFVPKHYLKTHCPSDVYKCFESSDECLTMQHVKDFLKFRGTLLLSY